MIEGITDEQDLFDHVAGHLFKQHAKSVSFVGRDTPSCRYRGDDDRKCAIGSVIDDAVYSSDMENTNLTGLRDSVDRSIGRSLADDEIRLLSALQNVHDQWPVCSWPQMLSDVADKFCLEFNFTEDDMKGCA
jgi:hypothetical protein